MNRIHTITPAVPATERFSKDRRPGTVLPDGSTPAPQTDYTDLSSEWNLESSSESLIKQALAAFQEKYPGIQIVITEGLKSEDLSAVAASLGEGSHLILSKEFLEKMGSSQSFYEKGKSAIIKLLNQLSATSDTFRAQGAYIGKDEISRWSAPKMSVPEDTSNKAYTPPGLAAMKDTSISKRLYSSKKSSLKMISYSFTRLSGARTKGQVQTIMADTRRNISDLRLSSCFGDSAERQKARAAIASMQKVLQRGSRKIRRLNEEELTTLRMKRAQRKQELEKALALQIERRKMQAKRRSADASIRKEGQLEELNQAFRFHKYNKYQLEKERESLASVPELSVSSDPAPISPESGTLSAADISISTTSLGF